MRIKRSLKLFHLVHFLLSKDLHYQAQTFLCLLCKSFSKVDLCLLNVASLATQKSRRMQQFSALWFQQKAQYLLEACQTKVARRCCNQIYAPLTGHIFTRRKVIKKLTFVNAHCKYFSESFDQSFIESKSFILYFH